MKLNCTELMNSYRIFVVQLSLGSDNRLDGILIILIMMKQPTPSNVGHTWENLGIDTHPKGYYAIVDWNALILLLMDLPFRASQFQATTCLTPT